MDPNTETLDAKQETTTPSVEATATPVVSTPASTTDAKPTEAPASTTAPSPSEGEQTADKVISELSAKLSAPPAEEKKDSDAQSPPVPQPAKAEQTEEKVEDLPFHAHPRWQQKVEEARTLREEVESLKPMAERVVKLNQYCEANSITDAQLNDALELTALLNTNPAKALERLTPVMQVLQQYVNGDGLPEDLQQEVNEGKISLERAKQLNKTLAQQKVEEQRRLRSIETEQTRSRNSMVEAVNSWDKAKRATNPDFKPKVNASEPDGLWEFVQSRFNTMLQSAQVKTQQDVISLAEQAYENVTKGIGRLTPRPSVSRTLTSVGTSTTALPAPKTPDDVINLVASGGKYV